MSTIIKDGTGSGFTAGITKENRLLTQTLNHSLAFHQSFLNARTYSFAEVQSETMTASTENILCHIINNSNTQLLCINYVVVSGHEAHGFARAYVG